MGIGGSSKSFLFPCLGSPHSVGHQAGGQAVKKVVPHREKRRTRRMGRGSWPTRDAESRERGAGRAREALHAVTCSCSAASVPDCTGVSGELPLLALQQVAEALGRVARRGSHANSRK